MFKPELKNEVISLGAIYQASNEIKKIAWEGKINNKFIEPLIYSVYQTTSNEIEDIYINLKRLNTGLDFLRKQFVGDVFSRDAEVDRYFEAINVLVKNMNENSEIFSNLRDELSSHKENVTEDNLHEHAEFLSNQARISGEFLELARTERQAGNRTLLDVLNGETAFINSQSDSIAAKIEVLINSFTLLSLMGGLTLDNIELVKN